MLQPFVSTPPNDFRRPSVLLLSVTAHVLLVWAAFAPHAMTGFAGGDVARTDERPPIIERIRYLEILPAPVVKAPKGEAPSAKAVAPDEPMPAPPSARNTRAAPSISTLPRMRAPVIGPIALDAPAAVPDIDLSSKVNEVDTASIAAPRVSSLAKGIVGDSASLAAHTGPYLKDDVDKVVRPYDNNPKPVYPWRLQRQGVQGSFVAQFVVDSTGRVDESSMLFPPGAHSLFVDAVRQTLRKSRYYPAEFGGRKVNQLVEQRFTFILVSGRGEYR